MKKVVIIFFTIICFLMTGCSKDIYLDKPDETNLSYWITQRVSHNDFTDCTFLPGGFGMDMYLDGRYEAVNLENNASAPDIHVIYYVTGYPDLLDSPAVSRIEITDPTILVYGLTMKSSESDIDSRMEEYKFKKSDNTEPGIKAYYKSNTIFIFSSSSIIISASTTNNEGIIY